MGAVSSTDKPRILIVEDQVLFALHVADVVEDMGCEPIGPVGSVSAGLPLALQEELDAALLDIHLADQTVKPIADVLERRAIPFAFMTAYTRLHLPANHRGRPFLCKPFSDQQLRMAVATLIKGRPK
jgi:two-component SAPR family response regulator